ncbi:hypothetical protein GW17_00003350 [Ensete ventricosum]|nr:hypothetical protein GW17_00003350 [Ensete ventricosum]
MTSQRRSPPIPRGPSFSSISISLIAPHKLTPPPPPMPHISSMFQRAGSSRSSPKHFKPGSMGSSSGDSASVPDYDGSKVSARPETSLLVLNAPEPPPPWQELSGRVRRAVLAAGNRPSSSTKWFVSALLGLFPILRWGRHYDRKSFRRDLMAGLTLASLGIPQSIGYANLAKLDPQYGLCKLPSQAHIAYTHIITILILCNTDSSFVPPLIYAVMGTSRDIAIGPVAVVSLLLSSLTQKLVDPYTHPEAYRSLEAFAVGRSFASVRGYQLDGNKEMVAMGFMNIAGSLSSCYVATGSFSRTAVNVSAGCETTVSNMVMAITVFVSLLLLMKLLYYTPVAILASIILSALPGLIDIKEACRIWRVDKMDFLACLGAFLGVLFGSVEIGLLTAVIISFAKIIICALGHKIEMLGRIQGTDIFYSMRQYPSAVETPNLLILRIDSPFLNFMNANSVKERVLARITGGCDAAKERAGEMTRFVVLDMSNVSHIDTSGIPAVEEMHRKLTSDGVQLAIANPGWQVIHKMKLAGLVDVIGAEWIFLTVSEAVEAAGGCGNEEDSSLSG